MISRKDADLKIAELEEQLTNYKSRFRDLVVAQKRLIAENENLKESLKDLTNSSQNNDGEKSEDEITELKNKIVKLGQTLSAITSEKSRIETEFQLERKQLVLKVKELEEELKTVTPSDEEKQHVSDLENQVSQLKLDTHKNELELSNTIKNLQKAVNDERKKRKDKESVIEELNCQLTQMRNSINEKEASVKSLQNELDKMKRQVDDKTTSQTILENLKREIHTMQEGHDHAVQQEQMRVAKAEERARKLAAEHENRVSKLEQQLDQLSKLASTYDQHRQEDQHTIQTLKNRLIQLEMENNNSKCEEDQALINEETLLQQLDHISQQLIVNCKTDNQLERLKEILRNRFGDKAEENKLRTQYELLKQQFDEHKEKTSKNLNSDEINELRQKNCKLKSKLLDLEIANNNFKKSLKEQKQKEIELLEKEREICKNKINSCQTDYRNKVIAMERELEKLRKRTNTLLEEKEKQLMSIQQQYFPSYQFSEESSTTEVSKSRRSSKSSPGLQGSSTLLYYVEDTARKDAEITRLRKINSEQQNKIHDLEKKMYYMSQLQSQMQNDIERYEKQHEGNEDTNLRYLKNVLLNYLTSNDVNNKQHMLNAMFTILKFTDLEKNRVSKTVK